jgi:hypothetical protein
MIFGKMSLNDEYVNRGWTWFKTYYEKVCKGNITESAEEVFTAMGGRLPGKAKNTGGEKETPK